MRSEHNRKPAAPVIGPNRSPCLRFRGRRPSRSCARVSSLGARLGNKGKGGIAIDTRARISVAAGAALWGLFWIPLRALDAAGIDGVWATFVFYAVPALLLVPLGLAHLSRLRAGGWRLFATASLAAVSMVLYTEALLFTEVVRAILLYYLTPVWSTLLARIALGEAITRTRLLGIALGLAGLWVILADEVGVPLPRNPGDWMALASGVVWAFAAVRLKGERAGAAEIVFLYFALGAVLALATTALADGRAGAPPTLAAVLATLPWLVPALLLVVLPSAFLILWGVRRLSPGLVGLLFMTEITVGAVSAALLSGEPFGAAELAGCILVSTAGLVETPWRPGSPDQRAAEPTSTASRGSDLD